MNAAAMRRQYFRISLFFYLAWIVLFIIEGAYAATLPVRDLTTAIDAAVPVVPEFVWIYVSCYVFPFTLVMVCNDWHRLNVALAAKIGRAHV